jgi:hypothetical protein
MALAATPTTTTTPTTTPTVSTAATLQEVINSGENKQKI